MRQTNETNHMANTFEMRRPGQVQAIMMPVKVKRQAFFGEAPKRKVLCSCGAIAEVDLRVATTKMGLGKVVECRSCRNDRVAREREEMERHFSGEDEQVDEGG